MARNFDALTPAEEEQVKLARSMTDSTIRNLLRGVGVDDLNAYQLRRLAGVVIVAARRKDTAAPSETRASDGD